MKERKKDRKKGQRKNHWKKEESEQKNVGSMHEIMADQTDSIYRLTSA